MRIVLINPPHPAIGSRIPKEQLPPLGLLMVGGPLIDAGHSVHLIDAEFGPTVVALTRLLRARLPGCWIVYGGVFPTYHWRDILGAEPQINIIVRGEGEATMVALAAVLDGTTPAASPRALGGVLGIAFRRGSELTATGPAPMIRDLDAYRTGWELIDHRRYSYWGGKRAVVMQFSRGCPHLCTYCGQRGFWTQWRHRDPKKFAAEIARLVREQGVELVNFADENPTTSRKSWKAFLEALIAENVKVILIGSTRAGDIVRDADLLPLYRQAGVERFLMGMEHTDESTLERIKKGSTKADDREAIRLLRQHGILSLTTFVIGFEEETDRDYWRALRQLIAYDPDQINVLFTTPHRWTPYYQTATDRRVILTDQSRWDYKHQVLATRHMPPWRVFLWQKAIEALVQLRPRALARTWFNRDPAQSHGMRWYTRMGRRVWGHEILDFLFRAKRTRTGPTVAQYWGSTLVMEENALDKRGTRHKRMEAAE
jgi:anaerobic magnesium-protoporphyrin IX monomethyl ester cyclase